MFTFDGLRRMETAKDPLAKQTIFGYDERSLLKKRVSPAAEAGTAYFDHDGAGRVVKQFFTKLGGGADADIDFTYDEVGNLTLVEDDSGADTVQEFDKLDRMTSKTTVAGEVKFTFDASGKRTRTENPSLDKVDNTYDPKTGWLERVTVSDGVNPVRRHYYHYDSSGMPEKKLLAGNKVMSYYAWDDAGRLEQLQNLDDGAAVLSYFHYTRNAVGAETFVRHEAAGLSYFAHDALDRLTHERRVDSGARNFDKTFEYDATSNRSLEDDGVSGESTYYTYNVANLLTSTKQAPTVNPVTFEYDDAQRMTAQKDAGDQSTYFTYDQRDQSIQLDFEGGIADDTREFTFTGTGERAIVKTDTTPSYFAYDGSKLLEQRDTSGSAVFTYRHNLSFLDPRGSILEIAQAAGSLLFYPGFDQNGSTVTFVEDGGVFGPYESAYDFFGSVIFSDNESGQQARAFSPLMVDLDLGNTQIMASTAKPFVYEPRLAIIVPGGGVSFGPRGPNIWAQGKPDEPGCVVLDVISHTGYGRSQASVKKLDSAYSNAPFEEGLTKWRSAYPVALEPGSFNKAIPKIWVVSSKAEEFFPDGVSRPSPKGNRSVGHLFFLEVLVNSTRLCRPRTEESRVTWGEGDYLFPVFNGRTPAGFAQRTHDLSRPITQPNTKDIWRENPRGSHWTRGRNRAGGGEAWIFTDVPGLSYLPAGLEKWGNYLNQRHDIVDVGSRTYRARILLRMAQLYEAGKRFRSVFRGIRSSFGGVEPKPKRLRPPTHTFKSDPLYIGK